MRTYDDSFSGQRIYPGKVRFALFFPAGRFGCQRTPLPILGDKLAEQDVPAKGFRKFSGQISY